MAGRNVRGIGPGIASKRPPYPHRPRIGSVFSCEPAFLAQKRINWVCFASSRFTRRSPIGFVWRIDHIRSRADIPPKSSDERWSATCLGIVSPCQRAATARTTSSKTYASMPSHPRSYQGRPPNQAKCPFSAPKTAIAPKKGPQSISPQSISPSLTVTLGHWGQTLVYGRYKTNIVEGGWKAWSRRTESVVAQSVHHTPASVQAHGIGVPCIPYVTVLIPLSRWITVS